MPQPFPITVRSNPTTTSPSEQFEKDFKRAYLTNTAESGATDSSSFQRSQTLGFGASGAVFKVTNTELSTTHALKCLSKIRPREKFANEVDIMQAIGYHPNIVSLVYAFEDRNYYNIVMELCKGGELTDVLIKSAFTEQQASYYIRQILSAIKHCHDRGIVHRDIKPGNFIVQEQPDSEAASNSAPVLKMIDFGTALKVRDDEVVKGRAGTLLYSAPELFSDKYRRGRTGQVLKAADMWSLGVLLFVMVCGRPPFECSNSDDLIDAIVAGKYEFPPLLAMSDAVKDLLTGLLTTNPEQRLTADQALNHPWVVKGANVPISADVLVSLEAFVTRSKLKKLVGKVMSNQLTVRDENYLMSIFTKFDKDGDGRLGVRELTDFMRHLGHSTLDSEIQADLALNLYAHRPSVPSFQRSQPFRPSGYLTDTTSQTVADLSSSLACSSLLPASSGDKISNSSNCSPISDSNIGSCDGNRSEGSSNSCHPARTEVAHTSEHSINESRVASMSAENVSPVSSPSSQDKFKIHAAGMSDNSGESCTALVIHPRFNQPGLDFADFEEMYTTGRLSVSSHAMLASFRHFDRGQKGYVSKTDLEGAASASYSSSRIAYDDSSSPSSLVHSPYSASACAGPCSLKRTRSDLDEEGVAEDLVPPSSKLVDHVPAVLNAVESSEDGRLSFVEWVLAMQEVDLPLLLSQHVQPSDAALVLAYLGRSVVLSRLNFLQGDSLGSELRGGSV